MRKLGMLLIPMLVLILLASCGTTKKEDQVPEMLNVDLTVEPAKGEVNQNILFKAKVTQGTENVNDADDVVFEIWRSKDPNHKKFTIKHASKGVYSIEKSFSQEGTYYIISHVTARGMHNMPKKEFVVGNPSEPEKSSNSTMEGMEDKQSSTK